MRNQEQSRGCQASAGFFCMYEHKRMILSYFLNQFVQQSITRNIKFRKFGFVLVETLLDYVLC